MSKTLLLVRHAQAEEPDSHVKDEDRLLTPTGKRDATRLGNYLSDESVMPDLILTSTAVRAVNTAEIIAERIKYSLDKIKQEDEIYEASIRILLRIVNELSEKVDHVMLVAHNPAITFLADYLTSEDMGSISPGTLVGLSFDLDSWSHISQHTGTIKMMRNPD